VVATKQVIYEGFKAAVAAGVPRDRAGILVDEQFGSAILRDATRQGFITALSVEASGQDEFEFAYGDDFARHIEAVNPTFAKVLVRYNPGSDAELNGRQARRLRRLSEFLQESDRRLMFELLVPPEPAQLTQLDGDEGAYQLILRPALMVSAIAELQDAGVEPDVWKLEGMHQREDCERVVATARRASRTHVGCVILGRGSDEATVLAWLRLAAQVPGFTGFAVGRTTWWEPIHAWRTAKVTREEAISRIAREYAEWAAIFEQAHSN
jgi:5-dehydro-2-deoxygluconokinase